MKIVKLGCLMALATAPLCTEAGNVDVKRVEIEKESSVNFISCDGIGDQGLIITTKDNENQAKTKRGCDRLTFTKYDTLLNKVKGVDIEFTHENNVFIINENKVFKQFAKNNNLYRILMKKNGEYEVLYINGEDLSYKTSTGKVEKKSKLEYSQVMGDYVYMAGTNKGLPFVYAVNAKTGTGKMTNLTVPNKRRYNIMSFEAEDEQKEVHLFTKELLEDGYVMKLYVFVDGTVTNEMTFAPDAEGKYPATAFATKLKDGSYIISGTYSNKDVKQTGGSIGVFLKKVENNKTVYSSYTNYLDLQNFTSYMSERKQKRVEKKKAKKEEEGKEYVINYLMLPYKIVEENGKYLLVGEAYYPTYTTYVVTNYVNNGRGGTTPVTTTQTVFDGYAYTHYFIIEFDEQCKMEWSNSAPIEVLKTWVPTRHLSVSKTDNALELLYPSFGHMNHYSYSYSGVEVKKEEIEYVGDEVKLKRYRDLDTEYWYNDTFLSSGELKVKDDDGRRRIFSVNRIKCEK